MKVFFTLVSLFARPVTMLISVLLLLSFTTRHHGEAAPSSWQRGQLRGRTVFFWQGWGP